MMSKKRRHKSKLQKKKITLSDSIVTNKSNISQEEPSTSVSTVAKTSPTRKDSCDKAGVKRLYTAFNRFANNQGRAASGNKNKMALPHPDRITGLSNKEKSYIISSCESRLTRFLTLKSLASTAIKEHKIFAINGFNNVVRRSLVDRGWVEKIANDRMNLRKISNGSLSTQSEIQNELERLYLSNLMERQPPYFIWNTQNANARNFNRHNCPDTVLQYEPKENKLQTEALWTSKQGLCSSIKRNYWFYIENTSDVTCPRSYNTHDSADIEDFSNDYKITACTSLLKWVLSMVANERPIMMNNGKISLKTIVFALNRCKEYLFRKQNRDIDQNVVIVTQGQWKNFLKKYYRIIAREDVFASDNDEKMPLYLAYATFLLKEIYRYRPQLSCEGCHNIWIIKPSRDSRGRGIRMASKLGVITNLLNKANSKYVIQKYIEEPLLIHDTKFDIRQYYLVTSTYPLIIWMYKDCYLKFSSQKYNISSYHESIHLTNNAVQRKYTNCKDRHADLPKKNMWDSDRYKSYLSNIGKEQVWDHIIYPEMKKSIIGIMLSCQDFLVPSKNRFELYGCDFVLDKTYKPWLLEINSSPDLNHTTPVTAKICPAVIADVIKVVIDYPRDRNSSTGNFECIYRQPMTIPKPAPDLCIRGYGLPSNYFYRGAIPTQSYIGHDEDFDIEKAENCKSIIEKIEKFYNLDSIMREFEEHEGESSSGTAGRSPSLDLFPSTKSDNELSLAATVITTQLDEIIDRIMPQKSITTVSKTGTTPTETTSPQPSQEVVKETQSKTILEKLLDMKPNSLSENESNKTIMDFDVIKKLFELIDTKTYHDLFSKLEGNSETKNVTQEAMTQILNFLVKKEKEYSEVGIVD